MKKSLFALLLLCVLPAKASDLIDRLYWHSPEPEPTEHEDLLEGEFGMLLQSGNSKSYSLNAKMRMEHEFTHWSNSYQGTLLYKQKSQDGQSNTNAQRWFFSAQMEYKLAEPQHRFFIYADLEHDRFDNYEYEFAVASGWSSQLWKDEESELKYSIGPGYSLAPIQAGIEGEDKKGLVARGAIEYKLKISEQAWLRQFISATADQGFTKSRAETSISTQLNDDLALKLSFVLRHNDNLSNDREKLDSETSVNLVYQFF